MKKRFSEEQIVKMIQEHKQGKSVSEISREYDVAEQTFYKWQQKYGDMKVSEVKKMKSLEDENARLKRLVAELSLEKMVMSDCIHKTKCSLRTVKKDIKSIL